MPSDWWIRIRMQEAQKHVDPDPQHWLIGGGGVEKRYELEPGSLCSVSVRHFAPFPFVLSSVERSLRAQKISS